MIRNYAPMLYKKFELEYSRNGQSANKLKTKPVGLLQKPTRSSENSFDPKDKTNNALEYWGLLREARDKFKMEKGDM